MREINVFSVRNWANVACNCPNVHCFEYDEYGHKAANCPDRNTTIWHTCTTENGTQGIRPDQPLGTNNGTGTGIAGQDCNHILIDIKVKVVIVHVEVIPDHTTDALTEALPYTITPAPIITTMTHHTGILHYIGAYQPTPEIAIVPKHAHHINPVRTPHLNPHPDPVGQQ